MRLAVTASAAAMAAALFSVVNAAEPAALDQGAKVYQRCAACHLASGQGVPGAFPALAGRVADAASLDAGRDYLVMSVVVGVSGEIVVNGSRIHGFMPAQAGLSDADIAAVLNHAMTLKSDPATPAPKAKIFTAEEVAAIKARYPGANANAIHKIRDAAFVAPAATAEKK